MSQTDVIVGPEPVLGSTPVAGAAVRDRRPPEHDGLTATLDRIGFTRAHKLILLLVVAGSFFDVVAQNNLGAAGPSLRSVFGISATSLTALATVLTVGIVVGKIIAGVMGDLKGRRFVLAFNLLLYCGGSLVCAVAPNYAVFVVGSAIVGLGLGGEMAIAMTMLSEVASTRYRGTLVASLNIGAGGIGNPAALGIALLVIGVFGGFFGGEAESWRWLFGLMLLPALLVVVYRRYLPESPRYLLSKGRVGETNRVLSALQAGRLGVLRDPTFRATTYVSADDAATAEVEPSRRVRFSELASGTLLRRTVSVGIASFMTFGAQTTLLVLMPTILVARGYSVTSSLGFTMVMNLGGLLGAIAGTISAHRLPRRLAVSCGAIIALFAALAFGLLSQSPALILILGALFQFFVLALNTTLFAWAPELYPTRIRSFGTSVISALGNTGGAILPLLGGVLFDTVGAAAVFVMLAVMYGVMAIAARFATETFGRSFEEINAELDEVPASA